jgi:anti-sigma regulatory factor (Ser/Thr protein kinase)
VIAAARATHSTVSVDLQSRTSPEYVDPGAFLTDPLAQVPASPTTSPATTSTVTGLPDLRWARHELKAGARSHSAVPSQTIEQLLIAVHEVVVNGLVHGGAPVHITLWPEVARLTCLVQDSGQGKVNPMTGFRHPDESQPMGLWVARQSVDDLFIGTSADGGCSVLLIAT